MDCIVSNVNIFNMFWNCIFFVSQMKSMEVHKMLYINDKKKMIAGICTAKDIRQKGLFRASAESNLRFGDRMLEVD